MTENSKKVIIGYLALTEIEKQEIKSYILNYEKLGYFEKGLETRKLSNEQRVVGPTLGNNCPCCGK